MDSIVILWKSRYSHLRHRSFLFQLNVDKKVNMGVVNRLKEEIIRSGVNKIGYAVVPENTTGQQQLRFNETLIPATIYDYKVLDSFALNRWKDLEKYTVSHNSINPILADKELDISRFEERIESIVAIDSNYVFLLDYSDSLEYGKFIELYSTIYGIIWSKREEYSEIIYDKEYRWNDRDIQAKIRKRFPLNIKDIEYQKG